MDVKIAQANTDKFLLPKPVKMWKKPYRPRSSLLSTASLVKAQMTETDDPSQLTMFNIISTPSVCRFCHRTHNQESARDLDKTSKQKPFKCQFCQAIFSISCLFIAHMENHTGKSLYRCEFCGVLFVDFFSMIAHRKEHLIFPCKYCSQKFVSNEEMHKHMSSSHYPKKKKKKLTRLSKLSKRAFSLKVDLILQQNTNILKPTHTCDVCYKSFPLLSYLLTHKRCHTKEKPYKCDTCGKNFKHSTVLKIHQQQHAGADAYECEYCKRVFSQWRHLASHVRIHANTCKPISKEHSKSSPVLLTSLLRNNSLTSDVLKPGQIVNASGTIENTIPAHSKGKLPIKIADPNPNPIMTAPLDFRQQTSAPAVRSSVIHQIGEDSSIINPKKLPSSLIVSTSIVSSPAISPTTTSISSINNSSSNASVVVSSPVSSSVLVPATVSSIINPVSLNQVAIPTRASPVSLVTKIKQENVDTTAVICPNLTNTVEIQRPASTEVQPINGKLAFPVLPFASIDQATTKDVQSIPKLPIKLKIKEESDKWLTNDVQMKAAVTPSSTPSPTLVSDLNLLKVEKIDSDSEGSVSYMEPSPEDNQPERASMLIKLEPMEINGDAKLNSPMESTADMNVANEVPPYEIVNNFRTIVPPETNDQSLVKEEHSSQMASNPEPMEHNNILENRSNFIKEEPISNLNTDDSVISLINAKPVKENHFTVEAANNTPNDQISSNVCVYCGEKTHSKELMEFLESNPGDKPFKCHFCGEKFAVGCLFSKHLENHTGDILYQCDVCHKIFEDFLTLIFHRKITHQGYMCEQCKQVFVCQSDLNRHTRLVHYTEKTYNCNHCDKTFLQKCNLNFHLHTHTGVQPYSCDECGRKFTRPGSLNAHMRTHKPYQCDICDKIFSTSGQLQCHAQLHARESLFKCDHCERRFPLKKSLHEHLCKEHAYENLPYECEECGKRYLYSYMLIQHRLSHRIGKNTHKEVVTDTLKETLFQS